MTQVTYKHVSSREHPHVEWIELHGDGILHECMVLKRDPLGNVLYIPINHLDQTDQRRVAVLLANRNATQFELWDLMAQTTLGNGMNALAYFHQLVKILTPNGKIIDPRSGQMGIASAGMVDTNRAA